MGKDGEPAVNAAEKGYVVVVQCDRAVGQTCPGFMCEHAFNARKDGFARYPVGQKLRYAAISCGGCPGRATLRKLTSLAHNLKKREKIDASTVVVHLASCITRTNHHGPRCPNIDYIKGQVARAGLDCLEDTRISQKAEEARKAGRYRS